MSKYILFSLVINSTGISIISGVNEPIPLICAPFLTNLLSKVGVFEFVTVVIISEFCTALFASLYATILVSKLEKSFFKISTKFFVFSKFLPTIRSSSNFLTVRRACACSYACPPVPINEAIFESLRANKSVAKP